jgi:predicted metalloprotease
MAVDSKPEEMFDRVMASAEPWMTAKEETEITKETLENVVKEENVCFLINDKQVRKEEGQKKKIHVCPYEHCGKLFSRPWRLASHIRSHINQVGS